MKSRLILASIIIGIIIIGNLSHVFAYDVSITVGPGSVEKQSVYLESGDRINYGLTVSGGQNKDILFTIIGPYVEPSSGTVYSYLRSDYVAPVTGNYDFIFDNKMSIISTKYVQFDWQITKPTLGVSYSDSGGYSTNTGFFYILLFVGIVGGIIAAVASHNRKKRKKSDHFGLDGIKDDKHSTEEPPKKSFEKRCWHSESWVRDDRMEICSSCGKELGKLIEKGNKSLSSFSGTPVGARKGWDKRGRGIKPVESQQKLDSFVTQSNIEDTSVVKETINDIERNEEALGLLKERLAKGEISIQEFQEIKKELS